MANLSLIGNVIRYSGFGDVRFIDKRHRNPIRTMTHPFADWQLAELGKLAQTDPAKLQRILNALWAANPGLYEELAGLSGVSNEVPEVIGFALVESGGNSMARLCESRIAVWEIVRAYRRAGSLDQLQAEFPNVEPSALEAAVNYGVENAVEVDHLIDRYEAMLEQRRAQYPYAR